MEGLSRIFSYEGYRMLDQSISTRDKTVVFKLERLESRKFECHRCSGPLTGNRGSHMVHLRELSVMGFESMVHVWRKKGDCAKCKKVRSEKVDFISDHTPHMTARLADWLGTMCEFAPVSRVANFTDIDNMTLRRIDYSRMRAMLKRYKIPEVHKISVDEVYSRSHSKSRNENRNEKFFTVITDLDTKRVIWVSDSRNKEALDEFFKIIGPDACKKIKLVATDQHDPYRASVRENCPNAKVVWDRFHIMQAFNEASNEVRKSLHDRLSPKDKAFPLTMGKYKYLFLKKPSRRSPSEQRHLDEVYRDNSDFAKIEIIKEFAYVFFDQKTEISALDTFNSLGMWIQQSGFDPLMRWWKHLYQNWDTVKNYFYSRITSALSEGVNNVIKALKRRSFGFRNMEYFKLKIMQVCGYLNSEFAGFQQIV